MEGTDVSDTLARPDSRRPRADRPLEEGRPCRSYAFGPGDDSVTVGDGASDAPSASGTVDVDRVRGDAGGGGGSRGGSG